MSAVDELFALLEEAGARVTFDPGRTNQGPCFFCGDPAGPHTLAVVGSYIIATRGGIAPRDPLTRPLCSSCAASRCRLCALPMRTTTPDGLCWACMPLPGHP